MTAKIWNKSWWITETREKKLDEKCYELAREAGFNVLGMLEHEFTPYGYTKLFLLAESHLAIHTFPEFGRTYVELSSCNETYFARFCECVAEEFEQVVAE